MLIKWIKLQNIRSYISSEISFSDGTTLLSGDIGSGKSTVLLSIEFALFGIIKGEISGNALLRKGESTGSVELCFILENKEIIIKRILKKKKDSIAQESTQIIIDNALKECAPVELKAKVLELLGYPLDVLNKKNLIYRYTVYTPQEEMKRIIFETREERLNTLRKVFGIDKYRRVRENSTIAIKRLKEQCREIKGYIADLEEKRNLEKELSNKKQIINEDLKPLMAEIERRRKQISIIVQDYQEKKKQQTEFNNIKNKLAGLESQDKMLAMQVSENEYIIKNELNEIDKIEILDLDISKKDSLEKEISKKEAFLAELKQKKASLNERIAMTNDKINLLEKYISESSIKTKKITEIKEHIEQITKAISPKKEFVDIADKKIIAISELSSKQAAINQKISHSKSIISKITGIDECPLCLQNVDHSHKKDITATQNKIISESKVELEQIAKQTETVNSELIEIKTKINAIEQKESTLKKHELELNSLSLIEKELISKKIELKQEQESLEKFNQEMQSLESNDLPGIERKINADKAILKSMIEQENKIKIKAEKEKRIIEFKSKNKELNEKNISIKKELSQLSNELKKYDEIDKIVANIESNLENNKKGLGNIELAVADKKARLSSMDDEIERIEKEISLKENKKKQFHRKNQYIDWLEKSFINIITSIEKNILVSLYNEFNALFQDWFGILIEDELIYAKLDDDFTPLVQQNGYDLEIENLSGGEKTALALAYRLALNKVINDITTAIRTKDLIILDEPTDGFSEQQLDKIRDVLEKLKMNQVIIVSHETKIESFVDNIISVNKNEHASKIGY